jgi:hypothetical protein
MILIKISITIDIPDHRWEYSNFLVRLLFTWPLQTRVTRWVCGKNRPKCSPRRVFSTWLDNFFRGKVVKKFFGSFCNFPKTAQRKKSPNRRIFAQSGHPYTNLLFWNWPLLTGRSLKRRWTRCAWTWTRWPFQNVSPKKRATRYKNDTIQKRYDTKTIQNELHDTKMIQNDTIQNELHDTKMIQIKTSYTIQ